MKYWTSYITDVGTYKKTNQDALLLKSAKTPYNTVLLGAIADGVGGLKCGELASSTIVHDLDRWFEIELPDYIKSVNCLEIVKESLLSVVYHANTKLREYMREKNIQLGTTIALLFLYENQYLTIHVGDTRVYWYAMDEIYQLTKDHTYVQREIDAGRMTVEEAKRSGREHILTQCIGSSQQIVPDVHTGIVRADSVFLICSDGFRNSISHEELKGMLESAGHCSKEDFCRIPYSAVERIKERGERDNISAVFVKCIQED